MQKTTLKSLNDVIKIIIENKNKLSKIRLAIEIMDNEMEELLRGKDWKGKGI